MLVMYYATFSRSISVVTYKFLSINVALISVTRCVFPSCLIKIFSYFLHILHFLLYVTHTHDYPCLISFPVSSSSTCPSPLRGECTSVCGGGGQVLWVHAQNCNRFCACIPDVRTFSLHIHRRTRLQIFYIAPKIPGAVLTIKALV